MFEDELKMIQIIEELTKINKFLLYNYIELDRRVTELEAANVLPISTPSL